MKIILFLLLAISIVQCLYAQENPVNQKQKDALYRLIDQYSQARERRDTVLLKKILTNDIDQLVSTGEWRTGIGSAVEGMLNSSTNNPGTRTLTIDKIKMLNTSCAVVDCKYEIKNTDGTVRKMWSTFIAVAEQGIWKISGIRNMAPAH